MVKQGQASVSYDKWTIIKILNLSIIQEELELNINRYNNLNLHISAYFYKSIPNYQLLNVKLQTDYVMNSTINKFKQLAPSIRIKRGILNPLGSIIKLITGNLDHDDAVRYEKIINSLQTHQNTLTKKITLISEMSKNLVKITNSTNNNFIQIDKELWEMRKTINKTNANLTIHNFVNVYNLFLHNFQLLYSHLDEIETCLTFSKLKTLHQSLVNSDELIKLLLEIEKSHKLVYPVSYDNLVNIEQCIELKAYSKGSQITFILDIPLIRDEIYIYYKIIPIPITNSYNHTQIVIPKYPYLLVKGDKMVSLSQPCYELHEATYLCYEDESQLPVEDICITALMKFSSNTSSCQPVSVEINTVKVEPVEKQRWILYSRDGNILTKICNNEKTKENIKGTYLLTLDDHCDAEIGGITLKTQHISASTMEFKKLPIINLPEINPVEPQMQQEPINLDNSDLVNLQHLNILLKNSESDVKDNYEKSVSVRNINIATIVLYLLLFLVISLFIFYEYRKFKCLYRNNQSVTNPSDNFESRGGRVMLPVTSPSSTTMSTASPSSITMC